MTNVPTVSFGATGFQAPSTTQVLTGVIADIQAAFSGKLNLSITNLASLGTSQGQLATSMTGSIVNANNAFLVQASQTDPAYASGRWQDAIGNLYSMQRNPSEPTALQIACNGAQGVNIPVGASLIDGSGNIYLATQAGVIPVGGSITLTFANLIPGPVAVPATVAPYQTIPGWDSATVISGAIGRNVESRAAFEQRRQDSVAGNSFGPIGAIIGAVAKVTGVLDYYGYNNNTANPVTINGVSIAANSIYVCVAGGAPLAVAQAILSKKGAGAPMTGNTTVTAFDSNPLYASPQPYTITYEIPAALQLLFKVVIANGPLVPSNAAQQVQSALLAAFAGDSRVGKLYGINLGYHADRLRGGFRHAGDRPDNLRSHRQRHGWYHHHRARYGIRRGWHLFHQPDADRRQRGDDLGIAGHRHQRAARAHQFAGLCHPVCTIDRRTRIMGPGRIHPDRLYQFSGCRGRGAYRRQHADGHLCHVGDHSFRRCAVRSGWVDRRRNGHHGLCQRLRRDRHLYGQQSADHRCLIHRNRIGYQSHG